MACAAGSKFSNRHVILIRIRIGRSLGESVHAYFPHAMYKVYLVLSCDFIVIFIACTVLMCCVEYRPCRAVFDFVELWECFVAPVGCRGSGDTPTPSSADDSAQWMVVCGVFVRRGAVVARRIIVNTWDIEMSVHCAAVPVWCVLFTSRD